MEKLSKLRLKRCLCLFPLDVGVKIIIVITAIWDVEQIVVLALVIDGSFYEMLHIDKAFM